MASEYIMCADQRFAGRAAAEIAAASGDERISCRYLTHSSYLISATASLDALLQRMTENRPVFVYALFPVLFHSTYSGTAELALEIAKTIGKGMSFRIEVVRESSAADGSAKTLEVELGTAIEGMGYAADLKSPKEVRVVIMVGSRVTVAGGAAGTLIDTIADYSRWGQKHTGLLNRAEMKIIEAFGLFGIDVPIGTRCIDIGAAPGGWTKFLAEKGASVFAIDAADMDYQMLGNECVVIKHGEQIRDGARIVHLKMGFDEAIKMLSGQRFGFAAIDMNVSPMESANAALMISALMEPDAPLLVTLKLCKPSDIDKMGSVADMLKGAYEGFVFRKLPHNRQEITMLAHRKLNIS